MLIASLLSQSHKINKYPDSTVTYPIQQKFRKTFPDTESYRELRRSPNSAKRLRNKSAAAILPEKDQSAINPQICEGQGGFSLFDWTGTRFNLHFKFRKLEVWPLLTIHNANIKKRTYPDHERRNSGAGTENKMSPWKERLIYSSGRGIWRTRKLKEEPVSTKVALDSCFSISQGNIPSTGVMLTSVGSFVSPWGKQSLPSID